MNNNAEPYFIKLFFVYSSYNGEESRKMQGNCRKNKRCDRKKEIIYNISVIKKGINID